MNKVNIEIDGQNLQVNQGSMVIEAADSAGITIPRFCYHKKLSVAANCRMCLVQVENAPKPLPACATPVSEGMKVQTKSKIAMDAQKSVMEFLLINHPLDCPICDQGGQCELQDVALEYGKDVSRFSEGKRSIQDKDIGPLIATEMTRCIHCTRCVRFGEEVAGLRELGATGRGEHISIGTFIENSVDSELSGNVIDICPVGALTSKPARFSARAWELKSRAGIAAHDGLGSHLFHYTHHNKVVKSVPRENESLNEVWLSDRDRFSYEAYHHPERLQEPEMKVDGRWQKVSWEVALKATSERLQKVIHDHGPSQIGALANASCTTEEYYLLQKLVRALGCKNIDYRSNVMDAQLQESYHAAFTQPLDQLENNRTILLVGFHPRMEVPLFNQRLIKAQKHGCDIYGIQSFADKTRYPLTFEWLVDKGDFAPKLMALTKAHCELTKTQIPASLEGLFLGVQVEEQDKIFALNLNQEGAKSVIIGEDVYTHPQASLIRNLCALLAKSMDANLEECAQGANAQGAKFAGFAPNLAPIGTQALPQPGLSGVSMLSEPLKAMLLMNVEPEFDSYNPRLSLETLSRNSDVICLTPFVTETMRDYADVLLPIVPNTETDGTFVNMYGQLQSFKAVSSPLAQARPAWKVVRVLGNFLHLDGFDYSQTAEILDELEAGFSEIKLVDSKIDTWLKQPISNQDFSYAGLIRLSPKAMYRIDNIVRRSTSLQKTKESKMMMNIFIHPETSLSQHLKNGDQVKVIQDSRPGSQEFTIIEDNKVPVGCVLLYSGFDDRCDLGAPYSSIELQKLSEG